MDVGRSLAILAMISLLFASGTAFAARAKKQPVPAQPGSAYQNKPIALGATVWYCAYGGATEILCRLGDIGHGLGSRLKQAIDPRLPKLVSDILNNPERLVKGHVSIPLHSVPFDFELVGQLAEAVMCGTNRACGVVFGESIDMLSALVSQFENGRPRGPGQLAVAASGGSDD